MIKENIEKVFSSFYRSPVGILKISSDGASVISIEFSGSDSEFKQEQACEIITSSKRQLDEYFAGKRFVFDLPLHPSGTDFQKRVWNEVSKIPAGETATYLAIAKILGSDKLTRAVGLANGANPIPIIIPCHRVIGSNGRLTGYAGGLDKKKWLLNHERQHLGKIADRLLF